MRKIFSFVAAHYVQVQSHELPRVEVRAACVEGEDIHSAFDKIKNFDTCAGAVEVFGSEVKHLCITHHEQLVREESHSQWERWAQLAREGELGEWQCVYTGPKTLETLRDESFARFMASFN